jgi:uncharacterized LabA/DUF88 family protein
VVDWLVPDRVVLFVDWQNAYNGARRAFFSSPQFHTDGQFFPDLIGNLLVHRPLPPNKDVRTWVEVRVYMGLPDATRDRKGHAARSKQIAALQARGITVIYRPLRYQGTQAQEKGIDVSLAIDFVALAADNKYDVGVLFSSDTDLIPALEFVRRHYPDKTVEVAAWNSSATNRRLSIPGANVWCHWLQANDYQSAKDSTDYNV